MSPRKGMGTKQAAFRLPADLIRRLDRLAERYARERPGLAVTRADVVRMLLTRAVEEEETSHGKA